MRLRDSKEFFEISSKQGVLVSGKPHRLEQFAVYTIFWTGEKVIDPESLTSVFHQPGVLQISQVS